MLNNTYYLVNSRMISRAADEMFFNHSWWKCNTASELGKYQMDHSTGLILVWFWHFIALHCIAPSHLGPRVHKGQVDHTGMWLPCSRMLAILTTPSWYPCACCNQRCQTSGHQMGIILQSLNRVRDGTRGMCQAGWKFCLNKCNLTKCSWGNIIMKTEYATVVIVAYSCH